MRPTFNVRDVDTIKMMEYGPKKTQENLQQNHSTHSELQFWCAMSSEGIYGPIFLEGYVNQEIYRAVLLDFIAFLHDALDREEFNRQWFMQDGARPHTVYDNLAILTVIHGTLIVVMICHLTHQI